MGGLTWELIGVPFDGYGRPGNHARAAQALREAGLLEAFGSSRVIDGGTLALPSASSKRGPRAGLVNEDALLAMTAALEHRVRDAAAAARVPFLYGGDCSVLLGAMLGLKAAGGEPGLVHVDGHEDTMPLDASEDGEAANVEIGLLLGVTGRWTARPLGFALPALQRPGLALVGQRDDAWRRAHNVGSLRDLGVWSRASDTIGGDVAAVGRAAVEHVSAHADRWWLHVDVDVLDPEEFAAQGLPDVEDEPGGLSCAQLTGLVGGALAAGVPAGCSISLYDPDQDPEGADARRIVEAVRSIVGGLTR